MNLNHDKNRRRIAVWKSRDDPAYNPPELPPKPFPPLREEWRPIERVSRADKALRRFSWEEGE